MGDLESELRGRQLYVAPARPAKRRPARGAEPRPLRGQDASVARPWRDVGGNACAKVPGEAGRLRAESYSGGRPGGGLVAEARMGARIRRGKSARRPLVRHAPGRTLS